jgi:hypothetical protein
MKTRQKFLVVAILLPASIVLASIEGYDYKGSAVSAARARCNHLRRHSQA